MRTILFEHPRIESSSHYNDVANTPLSSCLTSGYIASVLKENGFHVEIYDAYLDGDSYEECLQNLSRKKGTVLGVHGVYFWEHTPELFSFLSRLKKVRPDFFIIIYGLFPTFACKEIIEGFEFIDMVIIGEPEQTFPEVICSIDKDGFSLREPVFGTAYRKNGEIIRSGPRTPVENLDRLPLPVRSPAFQKKIGGAVLGSRGCYGNCSFCCINPFYGEVPAWRGRSPENICSEIESILPGLDRNYVYFLDANFFGRGSAGFSRALRIAGLIKELGNVEFGLECRCNDVNEHVFEQLVDAGLRDVFLGIESASTAGLKRMRKGVGPAKSVDAVMRVRALGIEPNIGFIMFEADSSLEDIRANFQFLKEYGLLNQLSTTADVLYHREIILKGMDRYSALDTLKRLNEKGFLDYEGFYGFYDPSVQFLADLMSSVCRTVLRHRDSSGSSIHWQTGETRLAIRINEFLVDLFEEWLTKLELKEISFHESQRKKMEDSAIETLEGLIIEEQISQM